MMHCPNEEYCLICSFNERYKCCYWRYLKGEVECSKKCECRRLCRSRPDIKIKALRVNLTEIPDFVKSKRFQKTCNGFSDLFIPEIKPYRGELKEAINSVKKADVKSLTISLLHFITPKGRFNKRFYRVKRAGGLHSFLNFDGKIILTTDIPNILCDRIDADRLCLYVESLKPDCITTFDTYYHDDQPTFITQIKMYETLEKTVRLSDKIKSPVIGLAIGPSNKLFEWYARCLVKLGCNLLAIPCFESRSRGSKKAGLGKIAERIQMIKSIHPDIQILLLSCSPSYPKVYGANYYSSYASWWMVDGENSFKKRVEKLKKYKRDAERYSKQRLVRKNGRGTL